MKLAINLATRGRPELLMATVMQTVANIRDPNTVFMVSADADDDKTIVALEIICKNTSRVIASIEDREDTVAEKWNRVLKVVPDADVYMPMCDERPVATAGFDQRMLAVAATFPDGIGLLINYLDNMSFTSIQAPTRRLTELMGYIYPTNWPYWFVDHWLRDVSKMIDREAFVEVRMDEIARPWTQELREPGFWGTLYDALYLERNTLATGILNSKDCATPDWQRQILKGKYRLIHQYSRMVNDGCRAMTQYPNLEVDERYLRMRRKAVTLMEELTPKIKADIERNGDIEAPRPVMVIDGVTTR